MGIIVANDRGQVLWARRIGGQDAWQFPQGGINPDETAEQALYRELYEEVGLAKQDVEIIGCTRGWLRYLLPKKLLRKGSMPLCIGQKQVWYLLRLKADESKINLQTQKKDEFDHWCWVSYWYPLGKVVSFKRDVYRKALRELSPLHSRHQRNMGA